MSDELRIALLVRQDLKMDKGKIAGQCCHACFGLMSVSKNQDLKYWSECAKIVLKVSTLEEMNDLRSRLTGMGIISYLVHDAGKTQIEAGSATVLAIGPAKKRDLDKILGHLKLL